MDIVQLRYFLMTAQTLNYSKAADKLYISRQSLRQAIQALEADLGAPLFHNNRNKISLTHLGNRFAELGEPVLASFLEMERNIRELTLSEVTLRLAFSCSLVTFILDNVPELLKEFCTQHPNVKVDMILSNNDEIEDLISSGRADCAVFMAMNRPDFPYVAKSLRSFRLCLTFLSDSKLGKKDCITLEDLDGKTCAGMGRLETSYQPLLKDLQERRLSLNYRMVYEAIDVFYLISHNNVYGFDVDFPSDLSIRDTCTRPIETYSWDLFFAYPTGRTAVYEELLSAFLQKHVQKSMSST